MAALSNVKDDIKSLVGSNSLASEIANAFSGIFTIEYFRLHKAYRINYVTLYCKANRTVSDALLLDREVLALGVPVDDMQVRSIQLAKDIITGSDNRLDSTLLIIVHLDKKGDEKLRAWGREFGLKIIPIFKPKAGALPTSDTLRRNLAQDLFTQDPFSLTGPVISDSDFFGRKNSAIETLRQLQAGRIISLFGIRKIGKTSLINRVVSLAKESGSPRIAMIDCSVDGFNKLSAPDALKAIAKVAKLAAHRGYAHISDALKRSDAELVPVFDDLWETKSDIPLAIIFDEVDYITPSSPIRPHWADDFNTFWREFRVVYQESQRMGAPLSILVSGVSSHSFRVESFSGIENAVLHFIPEGYLAPFARDASKAMLKDLCKRCGLILGQTGLDTIAQVCGDFPYWIRLAGSYIHRSIEVQGRPIQVSSDLLAKMLDDFVDAEGADIVTLALEDLRRKSSEPVDLLLKAINTNAIPLSEGKLLVRYGFAAQTPAGVTIVSSMIQKGAMNVGKSLATEVPTNFVANHAHKTIILASEEWAEELAVINRRRNLLEKKIRGLIHFALKLSSTKGENWADKVLKSLPERQRAELSALSGDALLEKLYWKELATIIGKYWPTFEATFGDKKRFESATDLVNDRPDAHAKEVDVADIALYRRELSWLEERLS